MHAYCLYRFRQKFSNMFWMEFLLIFVCLISSSFTIKPSNNYNNNDVLVDKLHSAALQVISLHSNSLKDEIQENCLQNFETFESRNAESLRKIVNNGKTHLLLDLDQLDLIPDPELMRALQITDLMHKLKDRFIFQQTYLQKLTDSLKHAIRAKSNRIVGATTLIRNLQALNGVIVIHIKNLGNIIWQNSPLGIHDLKFRVKDLKSNLRGIEQQLAKVTSSVDDIVMRNRPAIITGRKHFIGHNEIAFINSTITTINTVGRQDARHVINNLYRISRPELIRGVKHFVKPIFVKGSIRTSYANGIDLNKQIVTTNIPQMISGPIHFNSQLSIINDLTIEGKVNNLDLNNDIVFLNKPDIVFAPKIFTSPVIIANNVKALTIDGVNLTQLYNNALFSSEPQTIRSKLIFVKPLTTNMIAVDGQVNGIDISAMARQLVYTNRPVFVRGKKTFILDDVFVKNNLIIGRRIDGRKIPQDLFMRTKNQIVTAAKLFKGIVRFDGIIEAKGLVDGLRLPQDIVTLTKNETISGPIIFRQGIVANKHIDARRLVDGIDLSELRLHSLKLNDKIIRSNAKFNRKVMVGTIDLNGKVNGIKLDQLYDDAIFRDALNVEITGTKRFLNHVDIHKSFVYELNGGNISDFVSINKNETIRGQKTFAGHTSFSAITLNGLIDSVNIEELYRNRISLSRPDRITGMKNFLDHLTVIDGLVVGKRINDIVPQVDIVVKSKIQEINGLKIFRSNLNARNLKVMQPVSIKGKINNILINDLNSKTIKLNAHKSIPIHATLVNTTAKHLNVQNFINDININHFANNVMSISRPQIVYGPKFFKGEQQFHQVITSKGINGISLKELKANAVNLNENSRITAPFTFAHHLQIENPLVINGVVNGVNLTYLFNDAVYKVGHNIIKGHNVFKSGFRVNGNINAISFNGVDLSTQLLTNNRNHIIRGRVEFTNSLNIINHLLLTGLINDIDLSEFQRKVMKLNSENLIVGNIEMIGPTHVLSNMNIAGKLNGIDINKLFNDSVFLNGNQDIIGPKTLTANVQFLKNLNAMSINDMNIPLALNQIVFIDSPVVQYIDSAKTFTNDISTNGLHHSNGLVTTGPINNVNLLYLNANSVKVNQFNSLTGVQYFKDNIFVNNSIIKVFGRINGIDLVNDVIGLNFNKNGPQVIKGLKTFQRLVLHENSVINGLVNGLVLKNIADNTFYISGNQKVNSHKRIEGLSHFSLINNNIGILNGFKIPEQLVTLRDNQTIFSELIFNNQLNVNRNLIATGSISGQNLTKLITESLLKDVPQVLSQPLKFESMVFHQDVNVDKHVDNVDLSVLSNNVKQFTRVINITKDLMTLTVDRHHRISDYLFKLLEKSVFEIDQFVLYQVLDEVNGDHIEVYPNGIFSLSGKKTMSPTYQSIKYNAKEDIFDTKVITRGTPFIDEKIFYLNGEEFSIEISSVQSNISSKLTKSGHLIGSFNLFASSIIYLKINENTALLMSLHLNDGQVLVYLLESFPNSLSFKKVSQMDAGTATSKVIPFLMGTDVYVVVTRNHKMNCMGRETGTLIFILKNYIEFELIQHVPLMNVIDAVHFHFKGKHYLALSDVTPAEESKSPQTIFIYRDHKTNNRCSFTLFQKLYFQNTIQLIAFSFGAIHTEQQYIAAANSSTLIVWEKQGESGFNKNWPMQTKSAQVIAPLIISNQLFIIVGQNYKCHQSLIFKAETSGTALAPIVFRRDEL